jgi:hypothetical protein
MNSDAVLLHVMWRETMNRLDRYSRVVDEGKALESALDFAHFVTWSGLIKLFKINPQAHPLKVDGALLQWTAEELQRKVQERFRLNDTAPHLGESEMETVHDKLNLIAGYLSRLMPPPFIEGVNASEVTTIRPLVDLDDDKVVSLACLAESGEDRGAASGAPAPPPPFLVSL